MFRSSCALFQELPWPEPQDCCSGACVFLFRSLSFPVLPLPFVERVVVSSDGLGIFVARCSAVDGSSVVNCRGSCVFRASYTSGRWSSKAPRFQKTRSYGYVLLAFGEILFGIQMKSLFLDLPLPQPLPGAPQLRRGLPLHTHRHPRAHRRLRCRGALQLRRGARLDGDRAAGARAEWWQLARQELRRASAE